MRVVFLLRSTEIKPLFYRFVENDFSLLNDFSLSYPFHTAGVVAAAVSGAKLGEHCWGCRQLHRHCWGCERPPPHPTTVDRITTKRTQRMYDFPHSLSCVSTLSPLPSSPPLLPPLFSARLLPNLDDHCWGCSCSRCLAPRWASTAGVVIAPRQTLLGLRETAAAPHTRRPHLTK